jgi:hypothetical protein
MAVVCCQTVLAASGDPQDKEILGWIEFVLLGKSELELKAKLDTGAETSSLHTDSIRRFRRGRRDWVEFRVHDDDARRRVVFRKQVVRRVRIKEHSGPSQRRPVVKLDLCLGEHRRRIEVNLTDRSEFNYPLLLGRSALEGMVVVDSELTFTRKPDCAEEDEP